MPRIQERCYNEIKYPYLPAGEADLKLKLVFFAVILLLLMTMPGCVYVNLGPSPTPGPVITPSPIDVNYLPPPTTDSRPLPVSPDFVSVIAAIRPSVVAINTTIPGVDVFGGILALKGAGSGWIIDASGLIVTNNHVIEGADTISVTLEDGRPFSAQLVRSDPVSDLAVLKINASDLKAAKVGDSSRLRAGDWVLAMGNSLGQGIRATKGIVSAQGVSVSVGPGETLYNLIQTDAPINEGNSGGPLVNLLGEVVGITSIKVAEVGVEGMGYAISTREALPIISDLVRNGYAIRPWMGVSLYTVDQLVVLRYSLAVNQGALITGVASGSPADKAGLKAGDVITQLDGNNITSVDDLNKLVRSYKIDQQVSLTYYRGSVKSTASLILVQSPPPSS
jgi:serine protease Do